MCVPQHNFVDSEPCEALLLVISLNGLWDP